jgi:hypothetical protein
MSNTLDYILGNGNSNSNNNSIEIQDAEKNSNKNKKIKKNQSELTLNTAKNDDKNDTMTNNIDKILNNGLVKFENKMQTSMYFVCYKTMTEFCNSLKTSHNITIPQTFIDNHIISALPTLIKEYTGNLKKRCKKIINLEMICIGRKLDGKQCTRKKHNDTDFCRSHFIKLSNGRIDQPEKTIIRNKRGRKRKVEFDPRQYDNDYLTLWEDIINGQKVLIDSNNNIYTFDLEKPHYIGRKSIENKLDIVTILKEIAKKNKEELETNLETNLVDNLEIKSEPIIIEPIIEDKIELILINNNKDKEKEKEKKIKKEPKLKKEK